MSFDQFNASSLNYIQGVALRWFSPYVNELTFSFNIDSHSSSSTPITCGIPQGSILGPLLFCFLYMLPLGSSFQKYSVAYHCYADDTQLHLPVRSNDCCSISNLISCFEEVKLWMSDNFLKLNENKTEAIGFGSLLCITDLENQLGTLFV